MLFIILLLLLTPIILFITLRTKKEHFTTPVAVNVPAQNHLEGSPFLVGNSQDFKEKPLVPKDGKYRFRIPTLLYDGIWESKYDLKDGYQTCDWSPNSSYYPLDKDTYGTNLFFHKPEKKYEKDMCSPPECDWNTPINQNGTTYKQNYLKNKPYFPIKPTVEDVLEYPKQDNNDYFFNVPKMKVWNN